MKKVAKKIRRVVTRTENNKWVNAKGKKLTRTVTEEHLEIAKDFKIKWVPINSVKLWEDNPRFNDEAAEKLALVIADNGFRSPIVCWSKNKVIYKGNTTYKAAKILEKGLKIKDKNGKVVRTVTLDKLTGGKMPVIFHHFKSEIAAKAYGIADNKASELSDWDEDVLVEMMKSPEFKKLKVNVGFSDTELKMLEFYPPDEETQGKGKAAGVDLSFKIVLEVPQVEYEVVLESLKHFVEEFDNVTIR